MTTLMLVGIWLGLYWVLFLSSINSKFNVTHTISRSTTFSSVFCGFLGVIISKWKGRCETIAVSIYMYIIEVGVGPGGTDREKGAKTADLS